MQNSKIPSFLESSKEIPGFQIIPVKFQEWWNFLIPHWKSNSWLKPEWEKYPIRWNCQKIGHFQAIFRVPESFWKFSRMMKLWNSVLKIKFLDINWVGLIPYMLKSVKTSQFHGTGTFGILESWISGCRNHNLSPNMCKTNTNMLRMFFF